ncbi:MAG: KH domain-containing protein [Archaeoglobaceae archaeon]
MELEIEVPEDRIAVLIGKDGEVKKRIEELTGCRIKVRGNAVKLECGDSLSFMRARDVVTAIARGFSPEVAMKLLEDEMVVLEVIDLSQFVSEKAMQRVKGRIIGKEGRMRKQIEDTLGVNVAVSDKYVAIIGDADAVAAAREAVMMLIEGAQHSTVIRFMERKRREMKTRMLDWL